MLLIFFLAASCENTDGCELWSWINPNTWQLQSTIAISNNCYLKNNNYVEKKKMVGVISGKKGCLEAGIRIFHLTCLHLIL